MLLLKNEDVKRKQMDNKQYAEHLLKEVAFILPTETSLSVIKDVCMLVINQSTHLQQTTTDERADIAIHILNHTI